MVRVPINEWRAFFSRHKNRVNVFLLLLLLSFLHFLFFVSFLSSKRAPFICVAALHFLTPGPPITVDIKTWTARLMSFENPLEPFPSAFKAETPSPSSSACQTGRLSPASDPWSERPRKVSIVRRPRSLCLSAVDRCCWYPETGRGWQRRGRGRRRTRRRKRLASEKRRILSV